MLCDQSLALRETSTLTLHENIPTQDHEVQCIAHAVEETGFIRLAILFGSLSAGAAGTDSDVDLAVAGDRALTADEKASIIEAVATATGRPVDVVDLLADGGPILKHAITTGRRIYCTDPTVYARALSRMMFHEADFMPYYRRTLEQRRRRWIGA